MTLIDVRFLLVCMTTVDLKNSDTDTIYITMDEIEEIIDAPLPNSAKEYDSHWKSSSQPHAKVWDELGGNATPGFNGISVTFVKIKIAGGSELMICHVPIDSFIFLCTEEANHSLMGGIQYLVNKYKSRDSINYLYYQLNLSVYLFSELALPTVIHWK